MYFCVSKYTIHDTRRVLKAKLWYVRYTYTVSVRVCANTVLKVQNTVQVHTDTVGKSMGTKEKWKIQIRKDESFI